MWLSTISLCLTLLRVATSCPTDCQSCDNGRVQCVSVGLSQPPTTIPEDTVVIDLSQNDIHALQGLPSVPNAQSLRLPANKLERLEASDLSVAPGLMSLDLSQNSIVLVDENAFGELQDLKTISLTGNKLTTIGPIFQNNPQITSVRLGHNEITEIGENDFKDNTMVKMLDLSNNKITQVHEDAFKNLDMLRYLILSNNPIVTLPELSFSSTMLMLADFTNCQLTSVPKHMPSSLKDFRLGNNRIREILVDDFENVTDVTLITLNDNQIENVAHRAFGSLENLQELWMSRNQLVYIPRGLPESLEKLYMDNNHVVELEPTIFQYNVNLKYLNLEANNVMKIHQDSLKDVAKLEILNLQGNEVSLIDVGTFTNLPELTELILSNNPIQVFENGAFVDLFNLTKVSLAHIDHVVTGSETILDENILEAMPKLEQIDLTSSPFLTEKLVEILSESSEFTSNLKSLVLQYNELTTLPEIIKHIFPALETLILDGNPWKCNEKLAWLRDWIQSSSISFHRFEEPTCNRPRSLEGRLLSTVLDDELSDDTDQDVTETEPVNTENEQVHNEVEEPVNTEVKEPVNYENEQPITVENQQAPTNENENLPEISQSREPDRQEEAEQTPVQQEPEQGSQNNDLASVPGRGSSEIQSNGGTSGVRVIVKPKPNNPENAAKIKKKLDKAAKKAERMRKRLERQRKKKNKNGKKGNKKGKKDKRRKRRIGEKRGMRCKIEENGLRVCKLRKRCKILDDGSVRCRKRGNNKPKQKKPVEGN